jgi:hypothetical protein
MIKMIPGHDKFRRLGFHIFIAFSDPTDHHLNREKPDLDRLKQ